MESVKMKWAVKQIEKINLIDVRSPAEYNAGHIEGAKNIPMTGLIMNYDTFLKKDETYYIHCQSGVRSVNAINALESKGYNLINCKGGYLAR